MSTKLSQIQDILRSANISELSEFVRHFDVHLSLHELAVAIGDKPSVTPVTYTHEIRLYQGECAHYFPKIEAIKLMRHVNHAMGLKEAKADVEAQLQKHPKYVIIATATGYWAAYDLSNSWYRDLIVTRPRVSFEVHPIS